MYDENDDFICMNCGEIVSASECNAMGECRACVQHQEWENRLNYDADDE